VFNEKDSHEGARGFLAMFQHTVQSPMDVEPTGGPFHFPPLAAITPVVAILGRTPTRNGNMVLTIGDDGNDAALTQGSEVRFAIVAFVQTQAFRFVLTLADANAIDRLQQLEEIITVRLTQGEVQRMPIGINDQMTFPPFNPGLFRVADFLIRPFLDLTTLASW
jgi:hypothetical protein